MNEPHNKGPFWSHEEDAVLRELWGVKTSTFIGERLGRSSSGVSNRARVLKLQKPAGTPGVELWRPDEDEVLKARWGKDTSAVIGAQLGRSRRSVISRASKLRLAQIGGPAPNMSGGRLQWTEEQDAKLKVMWETNRPIKHIEAELGRSGSAVKFRVGVLHLQRGDESKASSIAHTMRNTVRVARAKVALRDEPPSLRGVIFAPTRIVQEPIPDDAVSLVDMSPKGCKWPFGDPRDPAFGYCGKENDGSSYCSEHHKRSVAAVVRVDA